ncbi:hypothetical protein BD410DRAFT_846856 [Rickenella mellea]|uniref:BTB domain-containing protein n=1 Tax=Rickenella mellea TaxID=50990 RepID=A0A4Y7PET3_9AGAM|nr:hypothetical protein BD410DRAFT_846856 [Rickenella mellea]
MSMKEIKATRMDLGDSKLVAKEELDRSRTYFCANVVFLVERRLFMLPRILFEGQSSVFKDMFLLPPPPSNINESNEEGGSVSNPIRLDGVKKTEFESFLRVLFPLYVRQ